MPRTSPIAPYKAQYSCYNKKQQQQQLYITIVHNESKKCSLTHLNVTINWEFQITSTSTNALSLSLSLTAPFVRVNQVLKNSREFNEYVPTKKRQNNAPEKKDVIIKAYKHIRYVQKYVKFNGNLLYIFCSS